MTAPRAIGVMRIIPGEYEAFGGWRISRVSASSWVAWRADGTGLDPVPTLLAARQQVWAQIYEENPS